MENNPFSRIREIVIEQGKRDPNNSFHVISNLNWSRYVRQVNYLATLLPSGKILDVGCGWGHTTAMLANLRPDIEVMGVDLNRTLAWDSLLDYGARYQVADALNLPYHSGQFDAAISFGSMEHTGNEKKFLGEINRVIKNNAPLVIFNLPNKYAISEFVGTLLGLDHHEHRYSQGVIKSIFFDVGFELIMTKREHIVPAQVDRVSRKIGKMFNRRYSALNKVDSVLIKTPLQLIAEDWMIQAKKVR